MVVVRYSNQAMAFRSYIKHPETGRPHRPGSWELEHSRADLTLVSKAQGRNHELTDEEREQIRAMPAMSSPIIVKALADPSSLTEEERRLAMDWPPEEQRRANIAAVGLGDMDPDEILARTAAYPGWLRTRDQADLIANRFNVRPALERMEFWAFPLDQKAADVLLRKPHEDFAYIKAKQQRELLTRPKPVWTGARERVVGLESQIEAERAYERSWELGEHCLLSTPEWIRQLEREDRNFGFNIYKTADVPLVYEEFLAAEKKRPSSRFLKYMLAESFQQLWEKFLHQKVFGVDGEIRYMNLLLRASHDSFPERRYMVWSTGDLEAPATDAAAFRNHHRQARIEWKIDLHPRYFVVMDREGFPPIKHIIVHRRAIFPEVWVYDAEWEPPANGDGRHDEDGYQGRIRMRYAYHAYMHFYPLTLEQGFDLKKLWMEQEDKSKPYPFPWTDIGVRVKQEKGKASSASAQATSLRGVYDYSKVLDDAFLAHPGEASSLQIYFVDPDNPINFGNTTALHELPTEVHGLCLGQVMNSRWAAAARHVSVPRGLDASNVTKQGQRVISQPLDSLGPIIVILDKAALAPDGPDDIPADAAADRGIPVQQTASTRVISCNDTWLAFLIITSLTMIVASLLHPILRPVTKAPNLDINISTLIRDNRYVRMPMSGSTEDASAHARRVKDY